MGEKIFSISEYLNFLNAGLEDFRAKIIGEVSEVSFGPTGHVYFHLKDENDESIIKCIIWKSRYEIYGVEIKEGVKIIALGAPNVHPKYGFSFIAETIEYSGEGILKKEYEKLKQKLAEEGAFAEARKRPLPVYPQKIGVITSLKGGAVMADFSNNLGKFGFKVKMVDSRVEGQAAVVDLLLAMKTLKKEKLDVLVIIRGGGSLESMMAFNNEALVREVTKFPSPVLTGIGHHKDEPLVALAADVSVSTPTAAANILNESWGEAAQLLERHKVNIIGNFEDILEGVNSLISRSLDSIREIRNMVYNKYRDIETEIKISFQNFRHALGDRGNTINDSWRKSIFGFGVLLSKADKQLEYAGKIIRSNDPESQLRRGYSITRYDGKIVRSAREAEIGKDINVQVFDGAIISRVKNINQTNKKQNG